MILTIKLKKNTKAVAMFRAFFHWTSCGETIIQHQGKANEWLPVTKIYCDRCGKVFYSLHKEAET